jgi:hypothetical protein
VYSKYLGRNQNFTLDFVDTFPDLDWDWREITSNYNISIDEIKANPDRPWDYQYLSCRYDLDYDFVKENREKGWNYTNLIFYGIIPESVYKSLPIPFAEPILVNYYTNRIDFDTLGIDRWDFLNKRGKIPSCGEENWRLMDIRNIKKYSKELSEIEIIKKEKSERSNITIDELRSNSGSWDWDVISNNRIFTLDIIKNNLDLSWNWDIISKRDDISTDMIEDNILLKWNWKVISSRKDIPLEYFLSTSKGENVLWVDSKEKILDTELDVSKSVRVRDWDWRLLSLHDDVTIDILTKYSDLDWHWPYILQSYFEKDYKMELEKLKKDKIVNSEVTD